MGDEKLCGVNVTAVSSVANRIRGELRSGRWIWQAIWKSSVTLTDNWVWRPLVDGFFEEFFIFYFKYEHWDSSWWGWDFFFNTHPMLKTKVLVFTSVSPLKIKTILFMLIPAEHFLLFLIVSAYRNWDLVIFQSHVIWILWCFYHRVFWMCQPVLLQSFH